MDGIKMNKKILLPSLVVLIAISASILMLNYETNDSVSVSEITETSIYVPSDISKAFPDYEIVFSSNAYATIDIVKVKDQVKYTVQGTVINIGDPEIWIDSTMNPELIGVVADRIKIEVDIEVDKVKKSKDIKKGDVITITITGDMVDNVLSLDTREQFELGEQVIVHVAEDPNDIVGENIHFVKLGEYGKYKIQNNKAFNDQNSNGKSIEATLNEAQ